MGRSPYPSTYSTPYSNGHSCGHLRSHSQVLLPALPAYADAAVEGHREPEERDRGGEPQDEEDDGHPEAEGDREQGEHDELRVARALERAAHDETHGVEEGPGEHDPHERAAEGAEGGGLEGRVGPPEGVHEGVGEEEDDEREEGDVDGAEEEGALRGAAILSFLACLHSFVISNDWLPPVCHSVWNDRSMTMFV